jgi:hypothetical protein
MTRQKTAGTISRAETQGRRVGHASCPASGNAFPPALLCASAPLPESFWVAAGGRQGRTCSTTWANRAKQSQFFDCRLRIVQNKPNLARVARQGQRWPGEPAGACWRQTKPISPGAARGASALLKRSYGTSHLQQASAKQSQFSPTAPRGAGRGSHQPSRRCGVLRQTNPILRLRIAPNKPNPGTSFKCQVSSVKQEKRIVEPSNFTLYTSNSAEGRPCNTYRCACLAAGRMLW